MRIVLFVHSLFSDWNHGNAHFIRGVAGELVRRGHDVRVYEPADGWSRTNLLAAHGERALRDAAKALPGLASTLYDRDLDVEEAVDRADAVVVHEWNPPWLVEAVGSTGVRALFHDTHHRAVTAPDEMGRYDLSGYAGVLAFGEAIAEVYRDQSWHDEVWTWHEAADVELFLPLDRPSAGDLVWVGNWGDGERTHELQEYLFSPARALGLSGAIHGVRYPNRGLRAIALSGLRYGGWLPNHRVAATFAQHRVTLHVPRRPYVEALPGIPTIRVFEALACGIPLISAPWEDAEGLFRDGDFLRARNGREMTCLLEQVLRDGELAAALASSGRETVLARHTCAHRVRELLDILEQLGVQNDQMAQL